MDCTNKNCPAYAKCLATYRGSRCKATRATYGVGDHITEYDRLVRKSPEELAQWLVLVEQRILDVQPALERPALYADWLDWLKQEVEI